MMFKELLPKILLTLFILYHFIMDVRESIQQKNNRELKLSDKSIVFGEVVVLCINNIIIFVLLIWGDFY